MKILGWCTHGDFRPDVIFSMFSREKPYCPHCGKNLTTPPPSPKKIYWCGHGCETAEDTRGGRYCRRHGARWFPAVKRGQHD